MATIEELVVKARPEGLSETADGFEEMEEGLAETEGQMEDTTSGLEDLQNRWTGLMGALVAGLAVATGGILSQVPVIGEAASGLGAILETLALKIDQDLRPQVSNLTDDFFDLSEDIAEADSSAEALGETLGGLATIISENVSTATDDLSIEQTIDFVIEVGQVAIDTSGLEERLKTRLRDTLTPEGLADVIKSVFPQVSVAQFLIETGTDWASDLASSFVSGAETKLDNATDTVTSKIESVVDTGIGIGEDFVSNLATGITNKASNLSEKAENLSDSVSGKIESVVDSGVSWGSSLVLDFAEGIKNNIAIAAAWAGNVADDVDEEIGGLVGDAKDWGEDLIDSLVSGIENNIDKVVDAAEDVAEAIDKHMPGSPAETGPLSDLDQSGPGLVDTFADGINANIGTVQAASQNLASGAKPTGFRAQRNTENRFFVDGRELTSSTGRYRADETSRRGRDS